MTRQPSDLALGWLTIGGADPFGWLAAAQAGGFGALGLKVAPRPGEAPPALLRDAGVRRAFDDACRHAGVGVLNMGSLWLDGKTDPAGYAEAMDVGAALGAEYVVGISTDPDPVRRTAHLRVLADMAQARGMWLTIEFFAYSAIPSYQAALALTAEIGAARAGVLFDALHFHRSGGNADHVGVEDCRRINYFQLCDAPRELPAGMTLSDEGRGARCFPGEGDIALGVILARLPATIRIEVEIPHPALKALPPAEQGREVMRRTLSFLDAQG